MFGKTQKLFSKSLLGFILMRDAHVDDTTLMIRGGKLRYWVRYLVLRYWPLTTCRLFTALLHSASGHGDLCILGILCWGRGVTGCDMICVIWQESPIIWTPFKACWRYFKAFWRSFKAFWRPFKAFWRTFKAFFNRAGHLRYYRIRLRY